MERRLYSGDPAAVGVAAQRLPVVSAVAERWVASGETSGLALLVARRGMVVLHEAFGRRTPAPGAPPMPRDALFPIASITKPITATAVMCLVEDGQVGLHRPAADYLPEFAGAGRDEVTLFHLLTHTSGLDDPAIDARLEHLLRATAPVPHAEVATWIAAICETPLKTRAGTAWAYSNAGYQILGEIVARVSGQPLPSFAEERIFAPLGMIETTFAVPDNQRGRVARRYLPDPPAGAYAAEYETRAGELAPLASGGVYSTAADLAVFGQMALQRGSYGPARILAPATVAAMTRNQVPGIRLQFDDEVWPEASYGLGWHIQGETRARRGSALCSPRTFEHHGMGGAYLWVDPEAEVVGVCLSLLREGAPGWYPAWRADLIVNAVMAAMGE